MNAEQECEFCSTKNRIHFCETGGFERIKNEHRCIIKFLYKLRSISMDHWILLSDSRIPDDISNNLEFYESLIFNHVTSDPKQNYDLVCDIIYISGNYISRFFDILDNLIAEISKIHEIPDLTPQLENLYYFEEAVKIMEKHELIDFSSITEYARLNANNLNFLLGNAKFILPYDIWEKINIDDIMHDLELFIKIESFVGQYTDTKDLMNTIHKRIIYFSRSSVNDGILETLKHVLATYDMAREHLMNIIKESDISMILNLLGATIIIN